MAALLKDDDVRSFSVRREGLDRLNKAIENPKEPPKKLIEMMKPRKDPVKSVK